MLVVVARLLVVLVIVGFVVSWDDLVGMLFDVVQVLGREVREFRDRDFDRLPRVVRDESECCYLRLEDRPVDLCDKVGAT